MNIRHSEVFRSFNGEGGPEMGAPTIWLRLWGCNFRCEGFSSHATNRLPLVPLAAVDVTDLPVIEAGCDSRYSWAKEYRHLSKSGTPSQIADKIETLLKTISNPKGHFAPPGCAVPYRLGLTGGEPLLNQTAIIAILNELSDRSNCPTHLCIETNGTQRLRSPIAQRLESIPERNLFWSVSPKLSNSGEDRAQAVKPPTVAEYHALGDAGQLKFVVDGSDDCWHEVEAVLAEYRDFGVDWPAYAMPVGATREQQEMLNENVALGALDRGFGFSGRMHCWVFGNRVGT